MGRTRSIGMTVMGILASFAFVPRAGARVPPGKNGSPDVSSATEIAYPVNTTTTGMVSLLLTLDSAGSVREAVVLQDAPPLTAAAQAGVQNWKFKAGSVHGKAAETLLPVYVVFNPYNPAGTAPVGGGQANYRAIGIRGRYPKDAFLRAS